MKLDFVVIDKALFYFRIVRRTRVEVRRLRRRQKRRAMDGNPLGSAMARLRLRISAHQLMLPDMDIEEIEAAISQLSPDDLARLAAWFTKFRGGAGKPQLDADVKGGKLDQLARQANEDSPPKRD